MTKREVFVSLCVCLCLFLDGSMLESFSGLLTHLFVHLVVVANLRLHLIYWFFFLKINCLSPVYQQLLFFNVNCNFDIVAEENKTCSYQPSL